MIAKREVWNYQKDEKIWVGKYRNSHNLVHWHPDCELLYVEHGSIDVFCDKRKYLLKEGDGLFVASGQMHYMHARTEDTVLIVIIFDNAILTPYFGNVILASPQFAHSYPVPELYQKLRAILTAQKPFRNAQAASELIGFLVNVFRGEKLTQRAETKSAQSLKDLMDEINEKYDYYTFEDAAKFMMMSPAYFSRYFHETTGHSFSQYLNFVRTDNAIRMIRTEKELSLTDISTKCGFGTIRSFNRVFKELTGYSPKQLPDDFVLDVKFAYPSNTSFNPTLIDCILTESSD